MIGANASVFDSTSLSSLKGTEGDEALMTAAREFEAVFLRMMLKSMRDALPPSGIDGSDHMREYQDMHDAQLAANLARTGGMGLADVIARQMRPPTSDPSAIRPTALRAYESTADASTVSSLPRAQQAYIDRVRPWAEQAARQLGTTPETLIAQSALETGWGTSSPAAGNNYFGIKADKRWSGDHMMAVTTEYEKDKPAEVSASFRKYSSPAQSFQDYAAFVAGSDRYKAVLGQSGRDYFQALAEGGYATDPAYAEKASAIHDRLKSAGSGPIYSPPSRSLELAANIDGAR